MSFVRPRNIMNVKREVNKYNANLDVRSAILHVPKDIIALRSRFRKRPNYTRKALSFTSRKIINTNILVI
jgi:hypothetical protein